ncbi:hypothetical protein DXG01_014041 [Tephrocybe rancida]|nr:hypothetical protein DXG01_014041 [Tephrocybe rancida]
MDDVTNFVSFEQLLEQSRYRYDVAQVAQVSVVLEGAARFWFAAIRLIVVTKEAGLTLHTCDGIDPYLYIPNTHRHTHRHGLAQQRDARLSDRDVLGLATDATLALPICTIVLEAAADARLRVIYDRAEACDPAHTTLHLYLACNTHFDPIVTHRILPHRSEGDSISSIYAYAFRVTPLAPGTACTQFPPQVLCRIAEFVITPKVKGWRKALMACAHVSKAWAHVVDVYFQNLGNGASSDAPTLAAVARSLELRPERGNLIRCLLVADYNMKRLMALGSYTAEEWSALFSILGKTDPANMNAIRLPVGIPAPIAGDLLARLSSLLDLKELHLGQYKGREIISISIDPILTQIAAWPGLRTLRLNGWLKSESSHATPSPSCKISDLDLAYGTLSGPHLRLFTPPSAPRLRKLKLAHVDGLLNSDFAPFLAAVAPTLEDLTVEDCEITRVTDEEFALDAVMPQLTTLVQLSVKSFGIASPRALPQD